MISFIFSTALSIVVICIVLSFFWIILVVSLIVGGIMAYEETHNVMWLGLTLLGYCIWSPALNP